MEEAIEYEEEEEVPFTYADASHNWLQRGLFKAIEPLTGQRMLKRLYFRYREQNRPPETFFEDALAILNVQVEFDPHQRDLIPEKGPLVMVANHPFGVVDGLILGQLIQSVREDFLILLNGILYQAPELRANALPLDFSGAPEAVATNLESRGRARQHISEGGAIVVFPAGAVSTVKHVFDFSPAEDPEWLPFTAHLIRQAKATVVPVFFEGQNSRLFQVVSQISMTVRLALLFNEVRQLMNRTVHVSIGDPIPFKDLEPIGKRMELAQHLKKVTYDLGRPPET